ncbi:hypothetical protein SLA2020_507080 [Shorea laevis]
MGNRIGKMGRCCGVPGEIFRRHDFIMEDELYEDLGHSFCYIPTEQAPLSSSKVYSLLEPISTSAAMTKTMTFGLISGASVSANVSTIPSGVLTDSRPHSATLERASNFEGTDCFASLPLQPVPRSGSSTLPGSGPIERGFMSGPIERGFLSGPLFSDTTEKEKLQRSLSHGSLDDADVQPLSRNLTLIKIFKKAISNKIKSFVSDNENVDLSSPGCLNTDDHDHGGDADFFMKSQNLQWAQGKAGEDRTHIVVSEEDGWAFVGIYDGFNGPDAPDHLVSNLYNVVQRELDGLLWKNGIESSGVLDFEEIENTQIADQENCPSKNGDLNSESKSKKNPRKKKKRRWEWDRETNSEETINHSDVLRALSEALRKTEEAYLGMVNENPALALMGSCVLVTVMKGDDVYLMNVGDSRAVLAQKAKAEALSQIEPFPNLTSLQLTMDHSTYAEEEVERIRQEHPDDDCAVVNDRVKGYLKVTRAFGAGFLKQPELNDAVLEMFRINYVGKSPYITCSPSLYHYKLSPKDRYLILSSDGLYQYFTNEEAVAEVESFLAFFPEGDPAQHLIEEVLFRAAKKAGIDFHELLDIPQGERRQYHDDVSVIIISLEGRIWRSSVNSDTI